MHSSAEARSYYARLIAGYGGSSDERLVAAFATVPRERFVGPRPWKVFALAGGYIETDFAARFVSLAGFIACEGARDGETARQLSRAFAAGGMWSVRSLRRNTAPDASAWLVSKGWWLSTSDSGEN
jgi:hypothetical protein